MVSEAIAAWYCSVTWVVCGVMFVPSVTVPGPLVAAPVSVIQIGMFGVPYVVRIATRLPGVLLMSSIAVPKEVLALGR